jgi:hypothetical protein
MVVLALARNTNSRPIRTIIFAHGAWILAIALGFNLFVWFEKQSMKERGRCDYWTLVLLGAITRGNEIADFSQAKRNRPPVEEGGRFT